MSNVIHATFNPEFRRDSVGWIKHRGIKSFEDLLIGQGAHPSFVKGLIRNIIRKEGW